MENSTEEAIDRLSCLPEPIRDHILSFLPMEDVVKTSTLSRQWRDICYSLSRLEFDQLEFEGRQGKSRDTLDFKNMVDHFLIYHDRSEISSFTLDLIPHPDRYDGEISDVHMHAWIHFAIKHKVRALKLCFFHRVLPCCLFTCHTLTVLRLKYLELYFPSMVSFPSLKRMTLSNVFVYGEKLTKNLFLGCPVLEELYLHNCFWYDFNTVTSTPPNLKVFHLEEYHVSTSSNINICSPNLQELLYLGPKPPNISSETLSSLVCVNFRTPRWGESKLLSPDANVTNLLMGLSNVAKLSLDANYFQFLCEDPDFAASLPTSCCSLRNLHVTMRSFNDSVKVLILLLRSYPNLETLHISFETKSDSKSILVSSEQAEVLFTGYFLKQFTRHLFKHVKTILIRDFLVANEDELHIVRYLLKNAISLKKMSIVRHRSVEEDVNFQLLVAESLLTFTKVSPEAEIVFS